MTTGLSLSEEFIALFNNLKEAAGNSPERVAVFYKDSKAVRDSLHALQEFLARTDLERRVFHGLKIVIPRAAGFEAAWKEYDEKWRFRVISPPLSGDKIAALLDAFEAGVDPDFITSTERRVEAEPPTAEGEPRDPDPELDDSFDPVRHNGGAAIELGIERLDEMAWNWNEPSDHAKNRCRLAVGAYDYLIETIRLDVDNVFRRWRKLPVVFMPAHVSNRYGTSDKGSLLHLLNDAVRAYVFGAPAAAIAMCRAALEMVLKRHYGRGQWEDVKLGQLVVLASQRYDFVQEKRITPLVEMGNRILHNYAQAERISPDDDRTILNFLKTVKFLIQRAPER